MNNSKDINKKELDVEYHIYRHTINRETEWLNLKKMGNQLIWTWKKGYCNATPLHTFYKALILKKKYINTFDDSNEIFIARVKITNNKKGE